MPEQNPYAAPQSSETIVQTAVPPVNRRHRQNPWEEPLRTQLADIARHDRAMLRWAALLAVAFVGIGAGTVLRHEELTLAGWRLLMLGLLSPVFILLAVQVYQLIARIDDSDSPAFMAIASLVPVFNLMLVFYCHNTAKEFLRDSSINAGWTGITPEQFAAQVELARETAQTLTPPGTLPVAEAVVRS